MCWCLADGFSRMDTALTTMCWKQRRICWLNTTKLHIYFRNNFNRWWESGSISNTLYSEKLIWYLDSELAHAVQDFCRDSGQNVKNCCKELFARCRKHSLYEMVDIFEDKKLRWYEIKRV
jgi:hypothetical protein